MESRFLLEVVTPEKVFFRNEVEMLIVRTTEGDMGVLKNHEPTVAPIDIGQLRVRTGDDEAIAAVSEGYIFVQKDKTLIVTDTAEWSNEIDIERAKASMEWAKKEIYEKKQADEISRAEIVLQRAINRIQVAERNDPS